MPQDPPEVVADVEEEELMPVQDIENVDFSDIAQDSTTNILDPETKETSSPVPVSSPPLQSPTLSNHQLNSIDKMMSQLDSLIENDEPDKKERKMDEPRDSGNQIAPSRKDEGIKEEPSDHQFAPPEAQGIATEAEEEREEDIKKETPQKDTEPLAKRTKTPIAKGTYSGLKLIRPPLGPQAKCPDKWDGGMNLSLCWDFTQSGLITWVTFFRGPD